ncbi:disease resistance protein [Pyrus ussuriensis x Pyrus communis]|uniref:Disease resistance protein n=1 Tax=Pyrus ussuriensis x Pyrus communis TaxID=2448454 RepID=A0A5N5HSJ5_9ROSA|nr:disease resistance protein [Pyrus ussuriensis x Pyrus communis]
MEIVIQIVGKVAEYAVEPAIRQLGYLAHCKRNLENLKNQVNELHAARERLALEIVGAENKVHRYKLGRRSTKLEQAVVELEGKGNFASISYEVYPQEVSMVSDKHYEAFDSRTSTVKKIMDELRTPNTDLILVYGIGGVGKTTLVEEVHRQAVKEKLFADAVMVRIRAPRLCDRVKDKKVLVILDNIWESIDLEAVGLPCLPNCRILLTSRTRKLLSSEKRLQKDFELRVLNEKEDARYALHAWIEKLKDSGLLLDTEDNTSITMHDLLLDTEDNTSITMHDLLRDMKELKVMDLTWVRISSLPPSLHLLQNLRTLCLDHCILGDITLVGQLLQLEILSFINSEFKELPEEIGKLTRLRLLDLKGCYKLEVISPNVISRLTSLEDLRMKNSFNGWVPEGVTGERSNASLSELKDLPRLAALSIHVPDAGSIPRDLFTDKLKRYQILIGASWEWYDVDETLNTLKLKLPTGCELDHGLEMLLKRSCECLQLDGSEGADNVAYHSGSEDFQQLKHLHVQNDAQYTHIITEEVVLRNLITLVVRDCNSLTFVLSSSMAGNCVSMEEIVSTKEYGCSALKDIRSSAIRFQNLTTLEVVGCHSLKYLATYTIAKTLKRLREMSVGECERMTEIGATTLDGDNAGNDGEISFCQLQRLNLFCLPSLQDFFSGNCVVKFPSLKTVNIYECPKLKINSFEWKSSPELQGVQITEDYSLW